MRLVFLLLFFIFVSSVFCSGIDKTKIISAKELHDKYLGDDSYILIDNRPKDKFEMAHIPSAINLTYFKAGSNENVMNKSILLKTIKDKSVIFYCTGYNRAYHASIDAIQKWNISSNKVFWFKGGMIEWQKHGYPINSKGRKK